MGFLKGLALSFLAFLLFLSLSFLGLAYMLEVTLLNPDFMVEEMEQLNVVSIIEEQLREQIELLGVPAAYQPYVDEVMNKTLHDLRPWLKEQIDAAVYTVYDYLEGRSHSLSLTVSLETVKANLKENLREVVLASPPPELQGLPPDAVELVLSELDRQIDMQLPAVYHIERADIEQVLSGLSLEQVRQSIGYFRLGYKLLAGFALLLILAIVLIYREVKGATRSLGITFFTCGVLTYLGNLATKYVSGVQLRQETIPLELQTGMRQLVADLLAPLDLYGIVLAAIGVVLLVVSFVYKPRESSM